MHYPELKVSFSYLPCNACQPLLHIIYLLKLTLQVGVALGVFASQMFYLSQVTTYNSEEKERLRVINST